MSLKLLVDMNLSPEWVAVFQRQGWSAIHWSERGDPRATDRVIMDWAQANQYVVFTHDLDFGCHPSRRAECDPGSRSRCVT